MNILIAPDSFKGSLSAQQFCQIAARQTKQAQPNVTVYQMPLADGGEGTIDAILANSSGRRLSKTVKNPLGAEISAQYAILESSHTAVIEMAQASGLPLLSPKEMNPMLTSSFGTGELIKAALDNGCRQFIIGLGGSATNDGGAGMLQALGAQFFDAQEQAISICGQSLKQIERIDLTLFDSRIKDSTIIMAGDVTNPLLGKEGATFTYGPQKGADPQMLAELEAGMKHFALKTTECFTLDAPLLKKLSGIPGAGAAGGMGYALMAYGQATMTSGFELIAEFAELDEKINSIKTRPDLIITGEGCFDKQSLQGKLVGRLIQRSDKHQIPILIICGIIENNMKELSKNISAFSLCNGSISKEYAMKNSVHLLEELLEKLLPNLLETMLIQDKTR